MLAVQQPKLTCLTLGLSQRLDLEINVGEMAIDYNEVAKKEHLTGVEISIRKLNDKIRDIMKEQAYQRVSLSPPLPSQTCSMAHCGRSRYAMACVCVAVSVGTARHERSRSVIPVRAPMHVSNGGPLPR